MSFWKKLKKAAQDVYDTARESVDTVTNVVTAGVVTDLTGSGVGNVTKETFNEVKGITWDDFKKFSGDILNYTNPMVYGNQLLQVADEKLLNSQVTGKLDYYTGGQASTALSDSVNFGKTLGDAVKGEDVSDNLASGARLAMLAKGSQGTIAKAIQQIAGDVVNTIMPTKEVVNNPYVADTGGYYEQSKNYIPYIVVGILTLTGIIILTSKKGK